MECTKCGAELTRAYIRNDGTIVCPSCGSIYRRKAAAEQPEIPIPPRQEKRIACAYCGHTLPSENAICQHCYYDPCVPGGGKRHQRWLWERAKENTPSIRAAVPATSKNMTASILRVFAWVLYVLAGLAALAALVVGIVTAVRSHDNALTVIGISFGAALGVLLLGFVSGTIVMGYSELIRLLHEINEKSGAGKSA